MSVQINKKTAKFMFWHSRHRPEPIDGVLCEESKSNCTCGAPTHDYWIKRGYFKAWKEHCKKTGFGWK